MSAAARPGGDRVLCVVQARMGSTRLPGKVLRPVAGRPMLQFMLDRLAGLRVDEVVVATSDHDRDTEIADLARACGRSVVRGPETDVLARFAAALDAHPADHVVRLTADCPLTDARLVESVIARHLRTGADYTSNVFPRTFPKGLDVEVARADALRAAHAEAVDPAEREHVTPFLYRRPDRFRLENVRHVAPLGAERWTVDTPEDLVVVEEIVTAMGCDDFGWEQAWAAVGPRAGRAPGELVLVPAGAEHCGFVAACRNDADAVRWSASRRAVGRGEHAAWYGRVLHDPGVRFRVALVHGEPVATVRADVRDARGAVAIAVAPGCRGHGVGTAALAAFVADCATDPQVVVLEALVDEGNEASLRLFAAAGFAAAGSRDGLRLLCRGVGTPMERA